MTTFTASEVRAIKKRTSWADSPDAIDALDAFAERLEADEKVQPVAFRYQAQQVATGAWVWSGWLDLGDPGIASLHVHCKTADSTKIEYAYAYAPPADTERLAEAVRNGLIDALRHQRQIDEDGAEVGVSRQAIDEAAAILSALAAHYAQSQPPAASVLDATQETAHKYHELLLAVAQKFPGETRHETALRYIKEAECQESSLVAQENPNG